MALKNLMARLQCRAADTSDTSQKITGYQRKAPIHAGCTPDTPDTPRFVDTRAFVQMRQLGEAVNDPASAEPGTLENLIKPNIAAAANDPAQAVMLVSKAGVSSQTPVSSNAVSTPVSTEPATPPIERAPNGNRIGAPFLSDELQVMARAYYAHHAHCPVCQAAGRGTGYGLRCGTGAVLHAAYETAYDESKARP